MTEPVTDDQSQPDTDDADRVVSRRVDRPTGASPSDEAAYQAANPASDPEPGEADTRRSPGGGAAEQAADELQDDDESEPTRSE